MSTPVQIEPRSDEAPAEETPLDILILDDMETDRMRLNRVCRKAGLNFRVRNAATLVEFRAALEGPPVDIAFIDYHLDMESGLDALAIMNEAEGQESAIAIMVSSLDQLDIAIEAMRMGCADYINKEELSVGAIRKSIALAFERRLLMASLGEARSSEDAMRLLLLRIARTCGHEIRSVIGATLEQARVVNETVPDASTAGLSASLQRLDRLCDVLGAYLRELGEDDGSLDGEFRVGPRLVAE